jgi:hypothetical protein
MLTTAILPLILFSGVIQVPSEAMDSIAPSWLEWMECVVNTSSKYVELSQAPETIAETALNQCAALGVEYKKSLDILRIDGKVRLTDTTKIMFMKDGRSRLRDQAIAHILKARLKTKNSGQR